MKIEIEISLCFYFNYGYLYFDKTTMIMSQKTYVMKALYYIVMLPTTDSINAADFAIFNAGINVA